MFLEYHNLTYSLFTFVRFTVKVDLGVSYVILQRFDGYNHRRSPTNQTYTPTFMFIRVRTEILLKNF